MRGTQRRIVISILVLAALAALGYQYRNEIHLADFSWSKLASSVHETNGWLLLIAVAAIYGCFAIRALRWKRFCRYLGPSLFGQVYGGTLMGFASIFLLGRAGELIRPLLLARKTQLPVSGMFGTYILERMFDSAATVIVAGLSLLLLPEILLGGGTGWEGEVRTVGILLLAGLAGMIGFLVYFRLRGADRMERYLAGWRGRGGWRERVVTQFKGFSEGLQAIRTISDLAMAILYSAAHWLLVALIYLWVADSFGGRLAMIHFRGAILVLAVTMIGSIVQLPGVGGGAQLASIFGFTKFFGVEHEPAVAAAFLTWLITFGGSCVAGVPLLIHEGLSLGELRRLVRAEVQAEAHGKHASDAEKLEVPQGRGESAR
jgi:uncharacterized protein (TIRG00374 family)